MTFQFQFDMVMSNEGTHGFIIGFSISHSEHKLRNVLQ